jgi:hypothetical protein
MASWILRCPGCQQRFTHSEIEETRFSALLCPDKPQFPASEFACPICGLIEIYQPHQLVYSRSALKDDTAD